MQFDNNYSEWAHRNEARIKTSETIYGKANRKRGAGEVDFGLGFWETKQLPGVCFQVTWLERTGDLVAIDTTDKELKFRRFAHLGVFQEEHTVRAIVFPLIQSTPDGQKGSLDLLAEKCLEAETLLNA